ncbi:SusC/RagA family TonB-linked outer membrane protein [Mucilaginibacter frigoritolerans]|nr:SusC/RagA family TonB-linked outer membrane protein [Mucilaginibacter frigoritolerans]
MKLTTLLMVIVFLQCSASGFSQKINLNETNSPLKKVLQQINKQSGYVFFYESRYVRNKNVSVKVQNVSVDEALTECLKHASLTYKIINNTIVLQEADPAVEARAREIAAITVEGVVYDDKKLPLPGVTVKVKDGTAGTVTDLSGKFKIKVDDNNAVLIFSFIGFAKKELHVTPGVSMEVYMEPDHSSLNEVVIVGYGSTTKKELTSAISTVKSDDFNAGVVATPADLLEGKVAGLNITNDGNPNGTASVTLRGPSSLRGGDASTPFYIIDGVPGADFNLIAPSDIASIDVLKDASAAAIYGTRATNGVIIVTTKKAKAGQFRLNYDAYASLEKISNQFAVATADQLRAYAKANNESFTPANDNGGNTNWEKAVERSSGFSQNHNLSFGGGTDKGSYGGSLNFLQNEGIIKTNSLDRFIGRMYVSQKALNDKLKLDFSVSNSISNSNLLVNDFPATSINGANPNLFKSVVQYLPTRTIYNADGTLYTDPTLLLGYNPVGLITNDTYKQKINILLANAKAELQLPFGLVYNLNLAYQDRTTADNTYHDAASELAQNLGGVAIRSEYEDTKKLLENYLSWGHNWNHKHDFKALFGYSYDETTTGNGFQSTNENFVSDATSYNNLSLGTAPDGYRVDYGTTEVETLRLISFYSRINYSFMDKYLFQASVRKDGSNAFGANHRWGYFPAVSAAWRITEESFMKDQTLFDDLKVRVGYGKTGNSLGFSPYTPLTQYGTTGTFYYNGSYIGAIGPTQNPNPNLQWETTATINAGVDFSILKGRLSGSVDVYNKKTTDMISVIPVSTVTYLVDYLTANVGSMSNKGVEISLTGIPVKTSHFSWESYGNIAFNKNLVTSLGVNLSKIYEGDPEGPGQSGIYTSIIQAGYPLGEFYTLKYIGRTNGVSTYLGADGKPTTTPTSADQTYAGNAQPTYTFGWGNNFTYKKFSLNFFFRGQGGNKIMDASLANFNQPTQVTDHNVPTLTLSEPANDVNANLYSTRYIESGAFIRLSNATLAYTIKVPGNYIHGLRFYLTGTNLFIITKYKGVDPELNLNLNNQQSGQFIGVDNNNYYPKTRDFLAGVQVNL